MKSRVISILMVLLFGGMVQGCSKSNPTGPSNGGNLLINPSFEINGSPSLDGWTHLHIDTTWFSFSTDVPQGGGTYSIALHAVWAPAYYVGQTVAADSGTHAYEFSVWAKKSGFAGGMELLLKRSDELLPLKSADIVDTTWTENMIIDTVTAENGDSLLVLVTGGFSQLLAGTTYFDVCDLEKLN